MYGKNFPQELITAGVGGLPFSWDQNGDFTFSDSITEEQKTIIHQVAQAHVPQVEIEIIIVSPAQMREALLDTPWNGSTLLDVILSAVNQGPRKLQIWFEFATQFESNDDMVNGMCADLGISEEQKIALFNLAKSKGG